VGNLKKVSILMVIAGIFFCLLVFKEFGANEEKVEKKAEKKIVIALEEQLLYVFEGDEQIYAFPCSTGKKKHLPRQEIFKFIEKFLNITAKDLTYGWRIG